MLRLFGQFGIRPMEGLSLVGLSLVQKSTAPHFELAPRQAFPQACHVLPTADAGINQKENQQGNH